MRILVSFKLYAVQTVGRLEIKSVARTPISKSTPHLNVTVTVLNRTNHINSWTMISEKRWTWVLPIEIRMFDSNPTSK